MHVHYMEKKSKKKKVPFSLFRVITALIKLSKLIHISLIIIRWNIS